MHGVPLDSDRPKPAGLSLRAFSKSLRIAWLVVFALTVISEVYPFPLLPPLPFYTIWCAKLLLFLILGFLAPLAFWRFNALNRGILLAAGSAAFVEARLISENANVKPEAAAAVPAAVKPRAHVTPSKRTHRSKWRGYRNSKSKPPPAQ